MKCRGDFDFKKNDKNMGAITDNLTDYLLTTVGNKLQTDPAQKEKAIESISEVIKTSIMNNKGLIITGLVLFGVAMATTNVVITKSVSK